MAQQNDGFAIGPVGPGTTVANITGGLYVLAVIGSTAAQLNIVGPDNSTFLAASPAVTTNVFQTPVYLPPGQVKFVNTTGAAVYAALTRIKLT